MGEPMYNYGDMQDKDRKAWEEHHRDSLYEPDPDASEDENIPTRDPSKDPYNIDPKQSRRIRTRYYTATYYQHQASRTLIDKPDFVLTDEEMMILWNMDGLAGEVGEMMDQVKKAIWHRHGVEGLKGKEFQKELGDVCWYLAALCTKLGFELGDVMLGNIEKLEVRFPDGYRQEETIVGKRHDEVSENDAPAREEDQVRRNFMKLDPLGNPYGLGHSGSTEGMNWKDDSGGEGREYVQGM